MARSLRKEIAGSPSQGMGDGGYTLGRSGLYLSIYIGKTHIAGIESLSYTETGGVTFQREVGSSFNEPVPQPYEITGTFTRWQVRGKTLRQLFSTMHLNLGGIDWRTIPFDIRLHQYFTSASGEKVFEDTSEYIKDCWITSYAVSQNDPTSNRMETVNFIARGVEESGKNINTLVSVASGDLSGS